MVVLSDAQGASQALVRYYAGDAKAFSEFDRITRKPLMAFAARFGGLNEADELTSSTLIAVAATKERPKSRWRADRPLGPWLSRILRNRWISSRRRRRREILEADLRNNETPHVLDVIAMTSKGTNEDPSRDLGAKLALAMNRLPEQDQQVLRLKYWEKLSNKKISQQLAVSPPTMSRWLTAARRRLRRELLNYAVPA